MIKINYISIDESENRFNAPYIAGTWAVTRGKEVIASGFDDEFKAIDYFSKYISKQLAIQLKVD